MRFFTVFPLMILPVAIYNLIALSGTEFSTAEKVRERMDAEFLSIPMTSGAEWAVTPGHALITFTIAILFFELIKSTSVGRAAVLNHAFSMVLFIVCIIEFLMRA